MGWLFMSEMRTKSQLIAHLTAPNEGWRTLAKCVKGSALWAVHENADSGKRLLACYLLGADQGAWGYKDMTESMGPCEISCPVAYLDMVPDPGGYATAWRARVRDAATRKASITGALKVGARVQLKSGLTLGRCPADRGCD